MSYAKLIKPLLGVPAGTPVKDIRLGADGSYTFLAYLPRDRLQEAKRWRQCRTDNDLPAFTDKGTAHREAHSRSVGARGRPRKSGKASSARVVLLLTDEQRDYLASIVSAPDTVQDLVRQTLIAHIGMPK